MKNSRLIGFFKILLFGGFAYFGVSRDVLESLLCFALLVGITVSEIYHDTKRFKRW